MKKTYAVLALIAIAILVAYALLPDRSFKEDLLPVPEGVTLDGYDDRSDGGASEASLSVNGGEAEFSCMLGADSVKFAWCGLLWNLDPHGEKNYRNWTFVDTVFVDVEARGISEVIVKVWTFDPDVTDIEKPATFKLLLKEVPVKEGRQRVAVPMEEFYTPDFWYETAQVSKEYNKRHQEKVARVEIVPGWNQPRGKKFTLKLYEVSFWGISNLYFGIVLVSFILLTIAAVGLRHKTGNDESKK
jgi:hypothetical protein